MIFPDPDPDEPLPKSQSDELSDSPIRHHIPAPWIQEAMIETAIVPRWRSIMARWFGKREEHRDGPITVVVYRWLSKTYLEDLRWEE